LTAIRRVARFIAEHEFLLLWIYGAPLLLSSSLPLILLLACLATIPFFWIARIVARGALSVPTPLDLPLALLLLMGLVGLAVTPDLRTSLRVYAEWIGGVALLYGMVNSLQSTEQRAWGTAALFGVAFVMASVGLVGTRWSSKYPELAPLYNLMPQLDVALLNPVGFNPNLVAGAVAPVLPLGMAVAMFGMYRWRWLLLALLVASFLVLLLSQSRSAWLGVGVGFLLMLLWRWQKLLWVLPGLALVLGVAVLVSPQAVTAFLTAGDSTSAGERLELWSRALYIVQDFPFTGIGMGTFNDIVRTLYPLFLISPDTVVPHAHNLYLQMAIDYGLPGFVAFIAMLTTVVALGTHTILRIRHGREGALAVGLVAGYIVYLIHGLTDVVTFSTKAAVIVWLLMALMVSLYRSNEAQRMNRVSGDK
jgi:putative inorganic carbon (HCO3(-)) transporter